jgi:signal transduction histidine kinase/CheY-like chemotaxis protein
MDLALTIALDAAFALLFFTTFVRWYRERSVLTRDTTVVFGTIAVVLFASSLRELVPAARGPLTQLAVVALLLVPAATLRLISDFRPAIGRIVWASVALGVGAAALYVATATPGPSGALRPPLPVTVAVVVAFVGLELFAAWCLLREAAVRVGAASVRLRLAALGTILFAGAILVAGAAQGVAPERAAVFTAASRTLSLLAAMTYLGAFAPPAWMRALWERSAAYAYLAELVRLPPGTDPSTIWSGLVAAARRLGVARGAAVLADPGGDTTVAAYSAGPAHGGDEAVEPPGPPHIAVSTEDLQGREVAGGVARELDATRPAFRDLLTGAGAERVYAVPVDGGEGVRATLLLLTARTPLFVEDDLGVVAVVAEHAGRAVGRERVMEERSRLVDQLRRINAELGHASSAKTEFLAAMSHELRTPLHAVIGFSELLMTPAPNAPPVDPTVAEYAGHIHGAGLHLLDLINDVLDLSRIEAGRLDLAFEEVDLSAVIHRTCKTMRPLAARKGIELTFPDPSGVVIEADAPRIRQILFNLLSNAVKFTPTGGRVDVSLEVTEDAVAIRVADTGPGIPEQDQERIFEPFEQSSATPLSGTEGTGLGLAVTRQLVEGHGGRIELHADGTGSRFTVVLPRRRAPGVAGATRPGAPESASVAGGRRVVLVGEDEPRAAELVRIHLEGAGYQVVIARDGVSVLEEAARLRPAAIVLDVVLPVLDGWEVLRRLKADDATCEIPVVIVSVIDEQELGFALGAVDYLVKPVSRQLLVAALERLVREIDPSRPTGAVDRMRVLAIDDDPEALELYTEKLGRAGYAVTAARGGHEGIRLAHEAAPDVILLDLLMPDLNGWEVAAALQTDPVTSRIPILVLTSHDLSEADKARLNGHVRHVLHKGADGLDGLVRWLEHVDRPTPQKEVAGTAPARVEP